MRSETLEGLLSIRAFYAAVYSAMSMEKSGFDEDRICPMPLTIFGNSFPLSVLFPTF